MKFNLEVEQGQRIMFVFKINKKDQIKSFICHLHTYIGCGHTGSFVLSSEPKPKPNKYKYIYKNKTACTPR